MTLQSVKSMCSSRNHYSQISPPDDLCIAVGGMPQAASQAVKLLAKRHKQSNPEVGLRGWREGANKTACAVTRVCTQTTNHKSIKSLNNQCSQHEGMHCRDDCWLLVWTCLIKEEICAHSQNRLRCLKGGSHFPCFVSGIKIKIWRRTASP